MRKNSHERRATSRGTPAWAREAPSATSQRVRVLLYEGFTPGKHKKAVAKVVRSIEADDLRSPDVKKLVGHPFHRAKLGYDARLLLRFVRARGDTACLVLEVIEGHAYDRSRFLRGATVDESALEAAPAEPVPTTEPIPYLPQTGTVFHWLGKPLCFDEAQSAVHRAPPPLVIVGAAGSGKTVLLLHKLREITYGGDEQQVLYVSRSSFLVESARRLFFADGADDDEREVDFLSHQQLLEGIHIPRGRPVAFRDFVPLFDRHRRALSFTDAHACFEELRGVIGAGATGALALDAYLGLGVKQSLFPPDQREAVFRLFEAYRRALPELGLYDPNLVAHDLLRAGVAPRYDFVCVDEVQDLTLAELAVVLARLKRPGRFLLAGDANQIVHPNFFSWAAVKTLFFRDPALAERQRLGVLDANFRNGQRVVDVGNRLLKVKHARFGSIDRESNHLVRPVSGDPGDVTLLRADARGATALAEQTARSAQVAVVVLRDEHKAEARKRFRTPLIFSVHEAKGLEYEAVILFDLVSSDRASFASACDGVTAADLEGDELRYARARDKADKSLDAYKFHVNALYVAITRAVRRLFVIEHDVEHPLLRLLDLRLADAATVDARASTRDEWREEAQRLERQGKQEQAEAIRRQVLGEQPVPWTVLAGDKLAELDAKAFQPNSPFTKARQQLLDFGCVHGDESLVAHLAAVGFAPAAPLAERPYLHTSGRTGPRPFVARAAQIRARALTPFVGKAKDALAAVDRHGLDHRTVHGLTPLMAALVARNASLAEQLLDRGARVDPLDPYGQTALHWALRVAFEDAAFAAEALPALYPRLGPPQLELDVDERLVTLGPNKIEYLLFHVVGATWAAHLSDRERGRLQGFGGRGLLELLCRLPTSVFPERKRRSAYVNAVLARNEPGSSYQPNRALWVRERPGHYAPNPALSVRAGDGFVPLRDLLGERRICAHWGPHAWGRLESLGPRARASQTSA